jgi:hypothetical protein
MSIKSKLSFMVVLGEESYSVLVSRAAVLNQKQATSNHAKGEIFRQDTSMVLEVG